MSETTKPTGNVIQNEAKKAQKNAFPAPLTLETIGNLGMSKRFYAACAAMQGLLAQHMVSEDDNLEIQPVYFTGYIAPDDGSINELVRDAYRIADKLLQIEEQ